MLATVRADGKVRLASRESHKHFEVHPSDSCRRCRSGGWKCLIERIPYRSRQSCITCGKAPCDFKEKWPGAIQNRLLPRLVEVASMIVAAAGGGPVGQDGFDLSALPRLSTGASEEETKLEAAESSSTCANTRATPVVQIDRETREEELATPSHDADRPTRALSLSSPGPSAFLPTNGSVEDDLHASTAIALSPTGAQPASIRNGEGALDEVDTFDVRTEVLEFGNPQEVRGSRERVGPCWLTHRSTPAMLQPSNGKIVIPSRTFQH